MNAIDNAAREYSRNNPELGSIDDSEETEDGVLYFFEYGTIMVNSSLQVERVD